MGRRPRKRLPIPISTWPLPRKIPCSRTSPCQVVSQPRPPSTSSLLPRVTDGNLLSSASAVPVLLQTFLNCDKSLASHMVPPGLRFKAATTPSASSMSSGAAGTTGTDYGSSGAGYGGSGLGGTGGQGSGIPQSSGFSNQVDQAFDPKRDVTGGRGDMTNGSA